MSDSGSEALKWSRRCGVRTAPRTTAITATATRATTTTTTEILVKLGNVQAHNGNGAFFVLCTDTHHRRFPQLRLWRKTKVVSFQKKRYYYRFEVT